MNAEKSLGMVLFISLLAVCSTAAGQEKSQQGGPRGPQPGWTTLSRGGAVYQFDADLEEGGSYRTTRFNIEAGPGYVWDQRRSVSLSLSYSYDGYRFSAGEEGGISASNPWEDIHSFSLGLPIRWGISEEWSAILVPSVRSTGESGADFDETITAGAVAGFAYRFGDNLIIGPGLVANSGLEEDATVFPILFVNWQITERLSLETGRGLAATLGPGLTLNYRANERWSYLVGGRYEKLRFRLDDRDSAPGGIGEDASFPLFASITRSFYPGTTVSLVGGLDLGGELRQENSSGQTVAEETYDPAGFLGFTFNFRL